MFKTSSLLIPAALFAIMLALGAWGWATCNVCDRSAVSFLQDLLGLVIGRNGVNLHTKGIPWSLDAAQGLSSLLWLMVAGIAGWWVVWAALRHDIRIMLAGRKSGHTIVCGLGPTGMQIVQNLGSSGEDVVVINRDVESDNAKICEQKAVPVLNGDATDRSILKLAGLSGAGRVVICTGDDATNVEVALNLKQHCNSGLRRKKLIAHVEMETDWLFSTLIDHHTRPLGDELVELRLFNTHEIATRVLIQALKPPTAFEQSRKSLFVVGFGSMGQEVVLHAIRAAPAGLMQKSSIIVLDRAADGLARTFARKFPAAAEFADVKFIVADLAADKPETWDAVEQEVQSNDPFGVVVCLNDDGNSLYAALGFRGLLDRMGRRAVPVHVRLEHHKSLGDLATSVENTDPDVQRLRAFGTLEDILGTDILFKSRLDRIAESFHNHWLADLPPDRRGEPQAQPWPLLAETYKMSNRRQADHIPIKLGQVGLKLEQTAAPVARQFASDEIDILAKLEHRRWTIEKRLLGWKQGPGSTDCQTNPDLVDWEKLPPESKKRNYDMIAKLPQILGQAGYEIRPSGPRT